jgi:hypothetical protein
MSSFSVRCSDPEAVRCRRTASTRRAMAHAGGVVNQRQGFLKRVVQPCTSDVKSLNQQSLLSISCAIALTMAVTVLPLLLPVVALGAQLVLEPPELVGESNASSTHYWFPTDMAVVRALSGACVAKHWPSRPPCMCVQLAMIMCGCPCECVLGGLSLPDHLNARRQPPARACGLSATCFTRGAQPPRHPSQ